MASRAEDLLRRWSEFIAELVPGPYSFRYDDYNNDLDSRELLADLLDDGTLSEAELELLRALDLTFIGATTADLLGPISDTYRPRTDAWWKLRRPLNAEDLFLADLVNMSLLASRADE